MGARGHRASQLSFLVRRGRCVFKSLMFQMTVAYACV